MKPLIALSLALAAIASAAPRIVGGPFIVNVGPRIATITWVVQEDEVLLRAPGNVEARTAPAFHVEKTTIGSLTPNTRYEFEVPGHPEAKGSFRTAPAAPTAAAPAPPFEFLVYGDTRTRHDVHRKVIQAVLKNGIPDFALHTGDLVENGSDDTLWPFFFDAERDLLRQTPIFPVLGNHERNARDFYEFFQAASPYYSFNWGNAHFSLINSDIANAGIDKAARDAFWEEQRQWLENDLKGAQSFEYRIIVAHHPPFSAVFNRQGSNPEMRALVPLFEQYHVSLAVFGHDHNYQRYLQNGINYVISGGGGAPLYDVDKPDPKTVQKAVSTENFVTVRVEGKLLKVQAHALDGSLIEEFEIRH